MENYKGIYWNTSDLVSCKQAYTILIMREGCTFEELKCLDFGCLDTYAAYCELSNWLNYERFERI